LHLRHHILRPLGRMKVREITRAKVLTWQAGLKRIDGKPGPLSPGTVNLVRTTLSAVLDFAVASQIIAVNPCRTLTASEKPSGDEKEKSILAEGDKEKLLASVGRRKWMADVIEVALGEALRLGEVAGLDWMDVDFDNKTLTVQRSVCKKTGNVGPTKG